MKKREFWLARDMGGFVTLCLFNHGPRVDNQEWRCALGPNTSVKALAVTATEADAWLEAMGLVLEPGYAVRLECKVVEQKRMPCTEEPPVPDELERLREERDSAIQEKNELLARLRAIAEAGP